MSGGFVARARNKKAVKVTPSAMANTYQQEVTGIVAPEPILAPAARCVGHLVQAIAGNPVMSVMDAPIRLFRHLNVMREELVKEENISEAKRMVEGLTFDTFEESVCAVQYKGIKVIDERYPEGNPKRYPYSKIVNDICDQYKLDDANRSNLQNGELAEESTILNFDIKFNAGKPGLFFYGKFMACNINDKIDFCFMFYRLNFKIAPDIIEQTIVKKFLWFVTGSEKQYDKKEYQMTQKQLKDFQDFFRLRLFKLLGSEIKALADTDPKDDYLSQMQKLDLSSKKNKLDFFKSRKENKESFKTSTKK